jgi:ADP-heptose:LPS heptosyltransferase
MGLAASLGDHIEICAIDGPLPDFDFHCPLISLPHAFKTDLSNIPASTPYLFAHAARVAELRREISQGSTKKICGLSWLSNNSATGKSRSVALSDLFDAVGSRDYIFVNLQYGDVSQEIADLHAEKGVSVRSIPTIDNYHDLDGFAALVDACDTIVTIDNTTAHMAGALNKRTFLLLPFVPDWRWLLDREDSPWYPSLRLFRQSVDGDWTDVFMALNTALRGMADLASLV